MTTIATALGANWAIASADPRITGPLIWSRAARSMPGVRGRPAVMTTTSQPLTRSSVVPPRARVGEPVTPDACSMSRATDAARPGTMSIRRISSAIPLIAARWAVVAPTPPAPMKPRRANRVGVRPRGLSDATQRAPRRYRLRRIARPGSEPIGAGFSSGPRTICRPSRSSASSACGVTMSSLATTTRRWPRRNASRTCSSPTTLIRVLPGPRAWRRRSRSPAGHRPRSRTGTCGRSVRRCAPPRS